MILFGVYCVLVLGIFLLFFFSKTAKKKLLMSIQFFSHNHYLQYLTMGIVALMVLVGVPAPIFGIGFGCLISNIYLATLVVTVGKILGDILTYYLVTYCFKQKVGNYEEKKRVYKAVKLFA